MDQGGGFSFSVFTKFNSSTLNEAAFEVVVDFSKVRSKSKWGVIPFRISDSGNIEVLMISTRHKNWSLPKGNLIKNLGPQRTALLEAYEEAGIDGKLQTKPILCTIGRSHIYLFPMEVIKLYEAWPESSFRKRKWIKLHKASCMLHRRGMRNAVKKLPYHRA